MAFLESPMEKARETFFSYFGENHHARLSSTPVVPVDDPKVPLIHTCLNRFKGTLNGRGRHRTCFSLRCIIASGDDVIDHFRKDANYHRFTEILGSWSFGDYFKEEAIRLSFNLLSKKYKLPESRIYATYFGGDTSSCLSLDGESKNLLQKYIGEERIMPSMSKDDFWMAGETGPCGPCIGFFFDCSDSQDGVGSVMNMTDCKFVEICRLVFVEFNRQADGVLGPMQAKHVLTGVNLECLVAILENKESHYDLDVYVDIFRNIYVCVGPGIKYYSGKIGGADTDGVDTAYRLLADHIRMIAVTNAPGSQLGLGNEGREYFLKCADKQAVQYGHAVLETNQEDYDVVLDAILRNEPDLCSELEEEIIQKIIKDEMMIYEKTIAELQDQDRPFDMEKKKKKDATAVVWYATRVIEFHGRRTPIILKNKDTLCSLVALSNVLLLGEKITLNLDIKKVSEGHLIYLIQSYLLYGSTQMQLEQNLELSEFNKQVLGVLSKLPGSLYFDVIFASSRGFERTSETALFGFLGVPLHHAWLLDPQDAKLGSSILRSSYSQLAYNVAVYESIQSSTPQKPGCEDDVFYSTLAFSLTRSEEFSSTSCARISTFLRGPQLTPYGFSSLHDDLEARQPAVLIWNEKLITIYKFEDKLYVLLNDLSLLSAETDAVWERITLADGDGVFVDCDFVPIDSKIQSILPLTKRERKKRNKKEKMGLKVPKEKEDRNKEKDDEKTEEKANISVSAKWLENAAPQTCSSQGMHGNLNISPIDFFGRSTHVIHQIKDGPCCLIAVCNVLLLKGDIFFEAHETVVSIEYLLNLVFSFLKESLKMQAHCYETQRKIWDVAGTLATGFDVDIVFTRTDGFTVTPEWLLLDCLDLNLRHGWIAAGDLLPGPEVSFESLTLAANEPGFPHAETIKEFLRGPQLTPIGLVSLEEELVENVPCILYWNHHYSSVVKINGVLLSLVTDSNYLRTSAVWQTVEVNGDGVYLDSNFTPIYTGLDAVLSGSYLVPETSTSEASTSFMKPDLEGITSHGDGLYLDRSFTQLCSGPDAALLRDNLHGSQVPKTWTPRSCTYSMRPYTKEDISHEKYVPGPHIVPETWEISLEDFVQIPGNEFSELRTIFADGTSLDVADTTKTGRVLGLDLLEELVFSHNAGLSWNGNFDLSCIFVINGDRAEIRAPYCDKFCEEAKSNDFFSYISTVVELFRIKGVGLPAFFTQLVRKLSNPPRRPSVCTPHQLEGFRHRLHGFWDCVLTTLALRSSLARAGLFSGIHRIRRLAPKDVRLALKAVLTNSHLEQDWRRPIIDAGHPVLKKVLQYKPRILDESNEKVAGDDILDGSNDKVAGGKKVHKEFGRYGPDVDSLSVFPRQVNEHGKTKEEVGLEWQQEEEKEKEPCYKLSELDLLSSHYLEGSLPIILEHLLCSDHLMTAELWEWLKEVLEDYTRPEVLGRGSWNLRRRVFRKHVYGRNLHRRVRSCDFGDYGRGRGRAGDFGHLGRGRAGDFGHRGRARGFGHHGRGRARGFGAAPVDNAL